MIDHGVRFDIWAGLKPCGAVKNSQLGSEPCIMPKGHEGPHTCEHGARY